MADDDIKPQPGEAAFKPETKRATVPTGMVQPCCQRAGCNADATWVPVMVLRSNPFALEPWESRAPSPSSALCDKHRDELQRHPDMMLTDAAWENITLECLKKGRSLPERHLLSWEFERIPTMDQLVDKVGEARARKASVKLARPMHVH